MIIVREITKDDIEAIINLWSAIWTATYRKSLGPDVLAGMLADLDANGISSMLPGTGERGYCATTNEHLQGTVVIAERGKTAYLWGLYVSSECQRKGLGSLLLKESANKLEHATHLEIRVLETSHSARNFYRKHGFGEVGRETEELLGGRAVDMIIMQAKVSNLKAQSQNS